MPSRNSLKLYSSHAYYHLYNRGVDKRLIFLDEQDYAVFTKMLARYVDPDYKPSPKETLRPSLASQAELLAYCLMSNHFHLLVYQKDDSGALEKLCRCLMTGYVMYFNKKYARLGPLFQGRYKASLIDNDTYLQHISRYIHLNPLDVNKPHKRYPHSSYAAYLTSSPQTLVATSKIKDLFEIGSYENFVDSYAELFKNRPKGDDLEFSGLS